MSWLVLVIVFWAFIVTCWLAIAFGLASAGWLLYKGWRGLKRRVRWSTLPRFAWGIGFVFGRDRAHGPAIGLCLLNRQVHLYWSAQ